MSYRESWKNVFIYFVIIWIYEYNILYNMMMNVVQLAEVDLFWSPAWSHSYQIEMIVLVTPEFLAKVNSLQLKQMV